MNSGAYMDQYDNRVLIGTGLAVLLLIIDGLLWVQFCMASGERCGWLLAVGDLIPKSAHYRSELVEVRGLDFYRLYVEFIGLCTVSIALVLFLYLSMIWRTGTKIPVILSGHSVKRDRHDAQLIRNACLGMLGFFSWHFFLGFGLRSVGRANFYFDSIHGNSVFVAQAFACIMLVAAMFGSIEFTRKLRRIAGCNNNNLG
jgi:hypothetical protein